MTGFYVNVLKISNLFIGVGITVLYIFDKRKKEVKCVYNVVFRPKLGIQVGILLLYP